MATSHALEDVERHSLQPSKSVRNIELLEDDDSDTSKSRFLPSKSGAVDGQTGRHVLYSIFFVSITIKIRVMCCYTRPIVDSVCRAMQLIL